MENSTPEGKKCTKCGQILPLEMFHMQPTGLLGRTAKCRECERLRGALKRHKLKHREEIDIPAEKVCCRCNRLLPSTEFYKTKYEKSGLRSQCKVCWKPIHQNWYLKNKDRNKKNSQRWTLRNLNRATEYRKSYSKSYRSSHRAEMAQRERKHQAAPIVWKLVSEEDWKTLVSLFGSRCLLCGETRNLTIDHIIPVSRCGYHEISNLQPLCKSCNSSKHDKIIDARPFEINSIEELRKLAAEQGFEAVQ